MAAKNSQRFSARCLWSDFFSRQATPFIVPCLEYIPHMPGGVKRKMHRRAVLRKKRKVRIARSLRECCRNIMTENSVFAVRHLLTFFARGTIIREGSPIWDYRAPALVRAPPAAAKSAEERTPAHAGTDTGASGRGQPGHCQVSRRLCQMVGAHHMNYHEMLVLYTIRESGFCTQKQVSDSFLLPRQTVHNVISGMRQRGCCKSALRTAPAGKRPLSSPRPGSATPAVDGQSGRHSSRRPSTGLDRKSCGPWPACCPSSIRRLTAPWKKPAPEEKCRNGRSTFGTEPVRRPADQPGSAADCTAGHACAADPGAV